MNFTENKKPLQMQGFKNMSEPEGLKTPYYQTIENYSIPIVSLRLQSKKIFMFLHVSTCFSLLLGKLLGKQS